MISQILKVFTGVFNYVVHTFAANWFILLFGITIAVVISVYIDAEKVRRLFLRRPRFLILGSVAFGAFTPLCACGTMAVVLSLVSSSMPWGAIMAFLISSPLMSPDTFVMLAGFMGMNFAIALTVSSVVLGLGAGWIAHTIEKRTSFLKDQIRLKTQEHNEQLNQKENRSRGEFLKVKNDRLPLAKLSMVSLRVDGSSTSTCCSSGITESGCKVNETEPSNYTNSDFIIRVVNKLKLKKLILSFFDLGIVKVLPLFLLFVVIAYLVKEYVPTEWIVKFFSGDNFYSIPLAALIGLPMYVSDATVLPLLQVLRDSGASEGALLAYMISGPATSIGVIGGLSVIMKRKAIYLYVVIILIGAIVLGYGYDMILQLF